MGGRNYNGIFVRDHYDILAIGAVSAEGIVAAAPHLVAIALEPVVLFRVKVCTQGVVNIVLNGLDLNFIEAGAN